VNRTMDQEKQRNKVKEKRTDDWRKKDESEKLVEHFLGKVGKKGKQTEKRKIGNEVEKIKFSQENAAENFLLGGYQICSDTMLENITSMEELREKL
jgi:hypothetical protein